MSDILITLTSCEVSECLWTIVISLDSEILVRTGDIQSDSHAFDDTSFQPDVVVSIDGFCLLMCKSIEPIQPV